MFDVVDFYRHLIIIPRFHKIHIIQFGVPVPIPQCPISFLNPRFCLPWMENIIEQQNINKRDSDLGNLLKLFRIESVF